MPQTLEQGVNILSRSVTWDAATRSGLAVFATDGVQIDGRRLSMGPGSVVMPGAPIPLLGDDHYSGSDAYLGVIDRLEVAPEGDQQVLRGQYRLTVEMDSEDNRRRLQMFEDGTARFSIMAVPEPVDGSVAIEGDTIVYRQWSPKHIVMAPTVIDSSATMRTITANTTAMAGVTPNTAPATEPATPAAEAATGGAPPATTASTAVATPPDGGEQVARSRPAQPDFVAELKEEKRKTGIMEACIRAGMPQLAEEYIARRFDNGTVFSAADVAMDLLGRIGRNQQEVSTGMTSPTITDDHIEKVGRSMLGALARKMGLTAEEVPEVDAVAPNHRRASYETIARSWIKAQGVDPSQYDQAEVLRLAAYPRRLEGVARAGAPTGSLPTMMENVANKTLLRGMYQQQSDGWKQLATRKDFNDFKSQNVVYLDMDAGITQRPENGKYRVWSFVDGGGAWQGFAYKDDIPFSWEMMVNDDLGALSEALVKLGEGIASDRANLIWDSLTGYNRAAGTREALGGFSLLREPGEATPRRAFAVANGNTVTGPIEVGTFDQMDAVFGTLTSPSGANLDGWEMQRVLAPRALQSTLMKFLDERFMPTQDSEKNIYAGQLTPITDRRLDNASTTEFYAVVGPVGGQDLFKYGHLAGYGTDGYELRVEMDPEDDAMHHRARTTFGTTGVTDWRRVVRSSGV